MRTRKDFDAWLWGELLLVAVLAASLALFLAFPGLHTRYDLPRLRLVLRTAMALGGGLVALLAAVRFTVEGRRLDLLLAAGFLVQSGSLLAFAIAPTLAGAPAHRPEAWSAIAADILGLALVAAAPFAPGRSRSRERALAEMLVAAAATLLAIWLALRAVGTALPPLDGGREPFELTGAVALQALLNLVALVGFGIRFRRTGEDLDRWLALAATLTLFAALDPVLTPLAAPGTVSQGDFLRMLGYAVLLVGVWRAIRFAEFGRAVAEERARVAREIHDGLAQYLFAISTHTAMLDAGAPPDETVPRLKAAAQAAQQEARFAVLALSSASGNAPFDAALSRYVEFLTADGELAVDLEIDPAVRLAPDEQIEIFRIVQEGLANVRRHANARTAEVRIGRRGDGERAVTIRDDGDGFDGEGAPAGQGLKNMRLRAQSIEGGFSLRSRPGAGTALEVVLR